MRSRQVVLRESSRHVSSDNKLKAPTRDDQGSLVSSNFSTCRFHTLSLGSRKFRAWGIRIDKRPICLPQNSSNFQISPEILKIKRNATRSRQSSRREERRSDLLVRNRKVKRPSKAQRRTRGRSRGRKIHPRRREKREKSGRPQLLPRNGPRNSAAAARGQTARGGAPENSAGTPTAHTCAICSLSTVEHLESGRTLAAAAYAAGCAPVVSVAFTNVAISPHQLPYLDFKLEEKELNKTCGWGVGLVAGDGL